MSSSLVASVEGWTSAGCRRSLAGLLGATLQEVTGVVALTIGAAFQTNRALEVVLLLWLLLVAVMLSCRSLMLAFGVVV
jgi:hypothetical protein